MGEVDALIRDKPDNPYFWELKGNLYFRSGKYRDAIPHLRKSLQISGGQESSLVQAELAKALLATGDGATLDEAIALLRRSILRDDSYAIAHHQLATALYKKGLGPQAELAAALGYFAEGNVKQAQIFANRALIKLQRGSPEWIRAEDIAKYKEPT